MAVPFAERSEAVSSRRLPESSSCEILEPVANVSGLSTDEALLLGEWLKSRGHNFIAIVDQPEGSTVLWKR